MPQRVIPRSPRECFDAFKDLSLAKLWVPGVKKVRIVTTDKEGAPQEVAFEFGASSAYSLIYRWDDQALRVRWVPASGVMDAVAGVASFTDHPQGCLFIYTLEALRGRSATHAEEVAEAFSQWMQKRSR
jgi:hypothetical protein